MNAGLESAEWLTLSADYTYEQYNYDMASRYLGWRSVPGFSYNNWNSTSKDEFQNIGVHAAVPHPQEVRRRPGLSIGFGYTTFRIAKPNLNQGGTTAVPSAIAYGWNKVENVMQTVRVIAKYRVTEKLSVRSGFAYERYEEKDWARDPMQAFMGNYDPTTPGGARNSPKGFSRSGWGQRGQTTRRISSAALSGTNSKAPARRVSRRPARNLSRRS